MKYLLIAVIIIAAAVIGFLYYKEKLSGAGADGGGEKEEKVESTENLPYKRKLLLTKNEWLFYKQLKIVADELDLAVLSKIRLADLVEVDKTAIGKNEFQKYFNKINKKHIDFALAKKENLRILLLIELDDSTHEKSQTVRDEFVNKILEKTGYKMLRTRGTGELKERIQALIG